MAGEISLRERKKQQTRTTLMEVSRRLFRAQGYDATTLEQIADEAVVSVPTLLTYFDSKERLALAAEYDAFAAFRSAVAAPDRTEDAVTIWRNHVYETAARVMVDTRTYVQDQRFIATNPGLLRRWLSLMRDYEDTIAIGVAQDFSTDPSKDLATRLLATTLAFGAASTTRNWISNDAKGDLAALQLTVIDFAIANMPRPGKPVVGARTKNARR